MWLPSGNKTHEAAQAFANSLLLRNINHEMVKGQGSGPGQLVAQNHRKVYQCKGESAD